MDKRGLELAVSTIIVTIIALVLLILLIAFLTGGFKTFKEKINLYLSSSNVDDVKASCNQFAMQNSEFEYCCINRTVKVSSNQKLQLTCLDSANQSWGTEITKLECGDIC